MKHRIFAAVIVFVICLSSAMASAAEAAKKKLLIIAGDPDGHPRATHEFVPGAKIMEALLKQYPDIEVTISRADDDWIEGPELIRQADGVILFVGEGARWVAAEPRRQMAMADLVDRGGGFVALHWAVGTKDAKHIEPFVDWLGMCHGGKDRKVAITETDLMPGDHPIAAGIEPFRIRDEWYYKLKSTKAEGKLTPVLSAKINDELYPVAWAFERDGNGRSFGFVGLHFHRNWKKPEYRKLVTSGIAWSLGLEPAKQLNVDLPDDIYRLPKAEPKGKGE